MAIWDDPLDVGLNLATGGVYGMGKGAKAVASGEATPRDVAGLVGGPGGSVGYGVGKMNYDAGMAGGKFLGDALTGNLGGKPFTGPSSRGPSAEERKLQDMYNAMMAYNRRRPEIAQTRMNALANQSTAYQGANNALATMYGGMPGAPPGGPRPNPGGMGLQPPQRPPMPLPQRAPMPPPGGFGPNVSRATPPRPPPPPMLPPMMPPGTGPSGVSFQGLPPSPMTPGLFAPPPPPTRFG